LPTKVIGEAFKKCQPSIYLEVNTNNNNNREEYLIIKVANALNEEIGLQIINS
jgi:hypothetical protein